MGSTESSRGTGDAGGFDRLRAANPAPDEERVRGLVATRLHPSPNRHVATFGVVAGVLVACALAAGVAVGRVSVNDAASPVSVPGAPDAALAGEVAGGQGRVPGVSNEVGRADVAPTSMPVWAPAALVAGPGLADKASSAAGYYLDVNTGTLKRAVEELSEVLDVAGGVTRQDFGWSAGSADGTGQSLSVSEDPTGSWSYSNPLIQTWCPEPVPLGSEATPGSRDTAVGGCESKAGVSEKDAVQQASAVLDKIGVTGVEWESGTDGYTTWATAWHTLGGNRTGLSWNFTFTSEGLAWATGFAAKVVQGPTYSVLGARTAVERVSEVRYAAFGPTPVGSGVVYASDVVEPGVAASSPRRGSGEEAERQVVSGAVGRVEVAWDPVVVEEAKLGLAQYWQPDGQLLLLPAYIVEGDGGAWSVIAVADTEVEFVNTSR